MEKWVALSRDIGALLPTSALIVSVQEVGRLDVVLRALEDEHREIVIGNAMPSDPLAFKTQAAFSGIWVGLAYEIVRLLRDRGLLPPDDVAAALMTGLEGVRVPLAKHEIQRDKKLREPLLMGYLDPQGQLTPSDNYDPQDKQRGHRMPSGITSCGSLTWLTYDHRTGCEQWIERRYLSDLTLSAAWKSAR
jgi:hypothetical protein